MIKRSLIPVLLLLLLLLVACDKTTKTESDYILIRNMTSGQAFLDLGETDIVTLDAYTDYKWYYDSESKAGEEDSLSFALTEIT
jgi:hypothetical protein